MKYESAKRYSLNKTKERYQKDKPARGGFGRDYRLSVGSITQEINVHFQRPKALYPIPESGGEVSAPWLEGAGHFIIHPPKYEKGIYIPHRFDTPGCLICAMTDPAAFGLPVTPATLGWKEKFSKFPAKSFWSMGGWIEEWHHIVPVQYTDKEGQSKSKTSREFCNSECSYCEDIEKYPRVFGKMFFMDFSYKQWWGPIDAVQEELSRIPKDGGYVYPTYYTCSKCHDGPLEFIERDWKTGDQKTIVMNMTDGCKFCGSKDLAINDHMADPKDGNGPPHTCICTDCGKSWPLLAHRAPKMLGRTRRMLKCEKCGNVDYPEIVLTHSDGLESWEEWDIYDVQITLFTQGENKQKNLDIVRWAVKEPDSRLFDPDFQGEDAEKWIKSFTEPLDLMGLHQVPTPDEVAARLGIPNIFDAGSGEQNKKKFVPRER